MNNLQYPVPFSPQGPCFKSNYQGCSVRKGVLRNFAKFTGKHLCQGLFFNKIAGACNSIRKGALAQVFSCEFCEISKNTFFTEPYSPSSNFSKSGQTILKCHLHHCWGEGGTVLRFYTLLIAGKVHLFDKKLFSSLITEHRQSFQNKI